jgi:hypothetical protein
MVPGSMLLAVCLFLGLIGFNPQLAFGVEAAAATLESTQGPRVQGRWVVPPGDWSGDLADRMQALGYEVASIDLASGVVTVAFDDGRVLTVDRNTGEFSLADATEQVVISGTATGEYQAVADRATMNVTFEFADDPGVSHEFAGVVSPDVSSNGQVAVAGTLDGESGSETVNLTTLSYRPDGSADASARALSTPRGVGSGTVVDELSGGLRGWLDGLFGAVAMLLFFVIVAVIVAVCVVTEMWARDQITDTVIYRLY